MKKAYKNVIPLNIKSYNIKKIILFFILTLLGYFGNHYSIPLLMDVDFLFGGIFAFLALLVLGIPLGTLAALIISTYTYFLWHQTYTIIIYTIEVFTIGILRKRFRYDLVHCSGIFWFFMGFPMAYFFYSHGLSMDHGTVILLCLKQSVNGILNALIASLIFTFFPIMPAVPSDGKKRGYPLRAILIDAMMALVLIPLLVVLVLEGKTSLIRYEKHATENMKTLISTVPYRLSTFIDAHFIPMTEFTALIGREMMVPSQRLQDATDAIRHIYGNIDNVSLINEKGVVIASSPLTGDTGKTRIGVHMGDSLLFNTIKNERKPLIFDDEHFFEREKSFIILASPVLKDGDFKGIGMASLNLSPMFRLMKQSEMSKNYFFTLLDKRGRIIHTTRSGGSVGSVYQEKMRERTVISKKPLLCRSTPIYEGLPPVTRYHHSFFVSEAQVSDLLQWKLIIEYPVAIIQKELYGLYSRALLILLVMVLFSLIPASILSRKLTDPILKLSRTTAFIDHSNVIPKRILSNTMHPPIEEVALLIENFNAMSRIIETSFFEVRAKQQESERLNEILESKVDELEQTEKMLKGQSIDLRERIKELNCHFQLSKIMEQKNLSFHEIMERAVQILPPAWKYSDIASSRIIFNKEIFNTPSFRETRWMQSSPIVAGGKKVGVIEIAYLEPINGETENPFLKEEDELLHTVSERLGNYIERSNAELALEESRITLRTILDSIDAVIFVTDMKSGEVLFINKQMREKNPESFIGQKCWRELTYGTPSCNPCDRRCLLDASNNPKDAFVWEGYSKEEGKWYIHHTRAVHWLDGRLVRLEIATDITRMKKIEKQLVQSQKMETIGTLAGGIAHDFNNILGSMLGFTGLAIDGAEKGSIMEDNLQEIYRAGNRAKDLIRQILTFARKTEEDLKPVRVSTIAKEVLKLMRSSIPSTIEMRSEIRSDAMVLGDPTRIHQIFLNIITNAAQAMEEEGGQISVQLKEISLEQKEAETIGNLVKGQYLEISIEDTGKGISPEIMEMIFEPYFTTKKPGEGTGMGLAVVQSIVRGLNGEITAESEGGRGTTFRVYLPVTGQKSSETSYTPPLLPRGEASILLVDDEPAILKLGKQSLESLGYKVTTCSQSPEALERFSASPLDFDLIITDFTMPHLTGDRLALAIRKIRPDVPVIICTGYSKYFSAEKAASMKIDAYLMKPVSHITLATTVRDILSGVH